MNPTVFEFANVGPRQANKQIELLFRILDGDAAKETTTAKTSTPSSKSSGGVGGAGPGCPQTTAGLKISTSVSSQYVQLVRPYSALIYCEALPFFTMELVNETIEIQETIVLEE